MEENQKILELDPNYAPAFNFMAGIYMEKGEYERDIFLSILGDPWDLKILAPKPVLYKLTPPRRWCYPFAKRL